MPATDPPTVRRPPRPVGAPDPAARRMAPISKEDAANDPAPMTFPVAELPDIPNTMQQPIGRAPAADEPTFTRGPARRPAPRVADPLLQWASGLQTSERRIYAGWLVEAGKHPDLDEAMQAAGFPFVTIKHGNGNLVTHWAVETANVFVVADGVQSISEMRGDPRRYGIAFAWRTLPGGRQQSQLRARVFLRELLMAGYAEPLTLTVKGTLTGDLIQALTRQYDVLDCAAAMRTATGKSPALPLYAFSIPLGPGAEVTRGSGSATKEITPVVAAIPDPVTKEHLIAHWVKRAWVSEIENRLDETIAWSVAESAAIGEGEEGEG